MSGLPQPLRSLQEGHWFKLICGASFQHLPAVRNLTLAYTLAGADCIDVAADPAVVHAARSAIEAAHHLQSTSLSNTQNHPNSPWLMVSLNDGEDPHFRKADFNPNHCPNDCPQPCVNSCPAEAIGFTDINSGVIAERCYGCGRCVPVCPVQHIHTTSYVAHPAVIGPLITQGQVDALEIHTQIGHLADFQRLWQDVAPYVDQLKLLAISCPNGEGVLTYLQALYQVCGPLPCPLIWQTDGRPMSGDIGAGATRASIKFGHKVLNAQLPGYVQLAGGTNWQTAAKLKAKGLLNPESMARDGDRDTINSHPYIAGIAYGSFARKLLAPIQAELESQAGVHHFLEDHPLLLRQAVLEAFSLVSHLKSGQHPQPVLRFLDSAGHGRDSPGLKDIESEMGNGSSV